MDGRSLKDLTDAELKEDLGMQELGPRKAIKYSGGDVTVELFRSFRRVKGVGATRKA